MKKVNKIQFVRIYVKEGENVGSAFIVPSKIEKIVTFNNNRIPVRIYYDSGNVDELHENASADDLFNLIKGEIYECNKKKVS